MIPKNWADWLNHRATDRQQRDLVRSLQSRQPVDSLIDLAGNDYLGLSLHPAVIAAAAQAAHTWGAGARASRLVTGTTQLHTDLEAALAQLMGQPAALVFSSGYAANVGLLTSLADQDTLIVSDAHIHASLIDGARLSRATLQVTPHSDTTSVEEALSEWSGPRALVLAESIYSVLGDAAPLQALAEICANHDALLVVDEAHGVGIRGNGAGLVRELGLEGHPNVIVTATLSKSLGAQGGVVLAPEELLADLVNTSRPFIYDTGLAPPAAAAALAARDLLDEDLIAGLHQRRDQLADQLRVERPAGAVVSAPLPSPQAALAAQAECLAAGVRVGCFRPPSVPDGISRLRITSNAGIPEADWQRAVSVITEAVARHQ